MQKHLLALCLTVTHSLNATGLNVEELPALPIIDLVYLSDCVLEVRPLSITHNSRHHEHRLSAMITTVHKGKANLAKDTVLVDLDLYAWPWGDSIPSGVNMLVFGSIDDSTHLVPYFQPTLSGIYLAHQGILYYPFQTDNPGPYYYHDTKNIALTWNLLLTVTKRDIGLVDTILSIKNKQYTWQGERSDALFRWIQQHRDLWIQKPHLSWHDQNLGALSNDIFSWIMQGGVYSQSWEAICLYHELVPDDIYAPTGALTYDQYVEYPPPFQGVDAKYFLLNIVLDTTQCNFERNLAALHLNCSDYSDEYSYFDKEDVRILLEGYLQSMHSIPARASFLFNAISCMTSVPKYKELRQQVFIPFLKLYLLQVSDPYFADSIRESINE